MAHEEEKRVEVSCDELIDSFSHEQFIDMCDIMIDRAQAAKDARQEELDKFDTPVLEEDMDEDFIDGPLDDDEDGA